MSTPPTLPCELWEEVLMHGGVRLSPPLMRALDVRRVAAVRIQRARRRLAPRWVHGERLRLTSPDGYVRVGVVCADVGPLRVRLQDRGHSYAFLPPRRGVRVRRCA